MLRLSRIDEISSAHHALGIEHLLCESHTEHLLVYFLVRHARIEHLLVNFLARHQIAIKTRIGEHLLIMLLASNICCVSSDSPGADASGPGADARGTMIQVRLVPRRLGYPTASSRSHQQGGNASRHRHCVSRSV